MVSWSKSQVRLKGRALGLGATHSSDGGIVNWLDQIRLRRSEIAAELSKLEHEDRALVARLVRAPRQSRPLHSN